MKLVLKVVALLVGLSIVLMWLSLPQNEGVVALTGLQNSVVIERDGRGVPTIRGESRSDVAQALGFLHAQERFFQMDLMRRAAAGELAELFGKEAISFDKERRFHQLRANAKKIYTNLSQEERELLAAYTQGVNQGLNALTVRPFEYLVLGMKPKEWLKEDSLLVGLSLFFELQDAKGSFDLARGYMQKELTSDLYDFFMNNGSIWASTLDGKKRPLLELPTTDVLLTTSGAEAEIDEMRLGGSNQWAVAGSRTEDGRAMLACDMHLNFSVPNIWYRVSFQYEDVSIIGVTIPGNPFMAIGSNQHISWGFTNGYLDTTDLVVVTEVENDHYATVDGPKPFAYEVETIFVKGQDPVHLDIKKTIWGPVMASYYYEKPVAVQWIAHLPTCLNLKLITLERAKSTRECLDLINYVKVPIMNFMVADSAGNIGWKWAGLLPNREGFDGSAPVDGQAVDALWKGFVATCTYPEVYNPPQGYLWTANNCALDGQPYASQYLNGARAHQIERRLKEADHVSSKDMLKIQLDDEAFFLQRWHALFSELVDDERLKNWDGRSSKESEAYMYIRHLRKVVYEYVLQEMLPRKCHFAINKFDFEEPVFAIASSKEHRQAIASLIASCSVEKSSWGSVNVLSIKHPFAKAMPALDWLLSMPEDAAGGDYCVPYLNIPTAGASERFIASPGAEEKGIFHMPCGQSGHPLSPHYRDGHQDWLLGNPSPLLPGQPKSVLILQTVPQD